MHLWPWNCTIVLQQLPYYSDGCCKENAMVYCDVLVQSQQQDRYARIALIVANNILTDYCTPRTTAIHSLLWVGGTTTSATPLLLMVLASTPSPVWFVSALRMVAGRTTMDRTGSVQAFGIPQRARRLFIASQRIALDYCFESCPTTGRLTWRQRDSADYLVQLSSTTVV